MLVKFAVVLTAVIVVFYGFSMLALAFGPMLAQVANMMP